MHFNLDENLQIMQAEATVDDLGPFNMIMDIKGVRAVFVVVLV